MGRMNATYYTCLNQHCVKHRNIFLDGDSAHEGCERAVFRLEDHAKPHGWRRFVVPALMALGAMAAIGVIRRKFA